MKRYILIFLVLTFSISSFAQAYKIKVKVKGVSDTTAYLGYYYLNKKYIKDTARVDHNGNVVFTGEEKLDQGMYIILFPSLKMRYFDIIVAKNQKLQFETDTADLYKNMLVKGDKENKEFYDFHKFMLVKNKDIDPWYKWLKKHKTDKDSIKIVREIITKKNNVIHTYWKDLHKKWDGHILGALAGAMIPIDIPEIKVPDNIANKDSVKQWQSYYYRKDHYFDYVNTTDDRMIRTPFLYEKIDYYLTKMVMQQPDSVLKEGMQLIDKAEGVAPKIHEILIRYMFNYKQKSRLMNMDKVFVEISKKYYLSGIATWADSSFLVKVKDRVEMMQMNMMGAQAPQLDSLVTMDTALVSLRFIPNKYLVVVFWAYDCGHCKKRIPELYKAFEGMRKDGIDIQVLSVSTGAKWKPWVKFVKDHNMLHWINAIDAFRKTNFRKKYDVITTPTVYLLDEHRKIIGKRVVTSQIEEIIYRKEGKEIPEFLKKEWKKK